jgi:hypothetical protein
MLPNLEIATPCKTVPHEKVLFPFFCMIIGKRDKAHDYE